MLASFSTPSVSAPYITSSVPYSSHQMHSSQENSARNQSLRRPYQVPNVLEESGEESLSLGLAISSIKVKPISHTWDFLMTSMEINMLIKFRTVKCM